MSNHATSATNARFGESSELPQNIFHGLLNTLLVSHSFLLLLVPLVISLFYFSTPQTRRRPLFILNLVAIFLAFVVGTMIDAFVIHTLIEPLKPWPLMFNVVFIFIGIWQSMFVDLILLLRLVSVYPPKQVGRVPFSFIVAIPVLLKVTRAANMIIFTKVLAETASQLDGSRKIEAAISDKPYLKIDWAAQMLDNTYVSLAFLWKIHDHRRKRISVNSMSSAVTLAQRMRTLFHIALTNFLVPTAFSIVQFVCIYHNVGAMILNQLVVANTMLSTFGITFATVWAGSVNCQDSGSTATKSTLVTVTHHSEITRDQEKATRSGHHRRHSRSSTIS